MTSWKVDNFDESGGCHCKHTFEVPENKGWLRRQHNYTMIKIPSSQQLMLAANSQQYDT